MSIQRPTYDKTRLGHLLGQSTKKSIERKEPDPKPFEVEEDLNKIESSQSVDMPKEKENVIYFEKPKEPDQVETLKKQERNFMEDALYVMKLDILKMIEHVSLLNLDFKVLLS